jgi:hypothetical protein
MLPRGLCPHVAPAFMTPGWLDSLRRAARVRCQIAGTTPASIKLYPPTPGTNQVSGDRARHLGPQKRYRLVTSAAGRPPPSAALRVGGSPGAPVRSAGAFQAWREWAGGVREPRPRPGEPPEPGAFRAWREWPRDVGSPVLGGGSPGTRSLFDRCGEL